MCWGMVGVIWAKRFFYRPNYFFSVFEKHNYTFFHLLIYRRPIKNSWNLLKTHHFISRSVKHMSEMHKMHRKLTILSVNVYTTIFGDSLFSMKTYNVTVKKLFEAHQSCWKLTICIMSLKYQKSMIFQWFSKVFEEP